MLEEQKLKRTDKAYMREYMRKYNQKKNNKIINQSQNEVFEKYEEIKQENQQLKKELETIKNQLYLANKEIELLKKYQPIQPIQPIQQIQQIQPVQQQTNEDNQPQRFKSFLKNAKSEKSFEKFYKEDMVILWEDVESMFIYGVEEGICSIFDRFYDSLDEDKRPIYNSNKKNKSLYIYNGEEFIIEDKPTFKNIEDRQQIINELARTEIGRFTEYIMSVVQKKLNKLVNNHKTKINDYQCEINYYENTELEGFDYYITEFKNSGMDRCDFSMFFLKPYFFEYTQKRDKCVKTIFNNIANKTFIEFTE